MDVTFLGAAQTVTGSMHLVRLGKISILLDCGLFQGRRRESFERNRNLPFDPEEIDAVILSHAHIDHSGVLPMLARGGFRGSVYTTPATRDLIAVMLEDAALIQASDARYVNKRIDSGEIEGEHVEPLYTTDDVVTILGQTVTVPYHRRMDVADGVSVTFLDAGHVLGSAIVVLDLVERGVARRLVFSGDLGRAGMPILRDPEIPEGAHMLILESTYGDRVHPTRAAMDDALGETITRTVERGGKVLIPTFALERAQEVVMSLKALSAAGRIPRVPIYIDSPLTVKITEVFRMHPECYDGPARAIFERGDSPFDLPGLRYVADVEESKSITSSSAPAIILAASGMCESGRVLHHLRAMIGGAENTVVIVGFQAEHTLGRRLVEKRPSVRIFGVPRERVCDVVVLNGFSAHAGQDDLLAFVRAVRERGALERIALVHGEPRAQRALAGLLESGGTVPVSIPARGDRLVLQGTPPVISAVN
jgi:metallo-beta-lactamase family protein